MVVMTPTVAVKGRAGKLETPVLWPDRGGRMAPGGNDEPAQRTRERTPVARGLPRARSGCAFGARALGRGGHRQDGPLGGRFGASARTPHTRLCVPRGR